MFRWHNCYGSKIRSYGFGNHIDAAPAQQKWTKRGCRALALFTRGDDLAIDPNVNVFGIRSGDAFKAMNINRKINPLRACILSYQRPDGIRNCETSDFKENAMVGLHVDAGA